MKTIPRLLYQCILTASFCVAAPISQEIDFQDYNPYSESIQGQPERDKNVWLGAANWLRCGVSAQSGNRYLGWPESYPATMSSQRIAFANAEGMPFLAKGKYAFSLDLRSTATPATQGFDSQQRIIVGGQTPANIDKGCAVAVVIFSNGRIAFTRGKDLTFAAKTYTGKVIDLDEYPGFITISLVIDYDTMTYSVDADGTPQTFEGALWFPFMGEREMFIDAGKLDITSPSTAPGRVVNFRRLAIDNIRFEYLP